MTTAPSPVPAVPKTRRGDTVDTLHGVAVPDPYRWLEDGDDPAVRAWSDAQQARTAAILGAFPGRDRLAARLDALSRIGTVTDATVHHGQFVFRRRSEAEEQPVLMVRDGIDSADRTLLDLNDGDGLTALDWWQVSPDGELLAYGTSRNGNEWSTLSVMRIADRTDLGIAIERTRYSSVAWHPDGSGFYYTRYPTPGTVPPGEENYNSRVFLHEIGSESETDSEVFGEGFTRETMFRVVLSRDGRWLAVTAVRGFFNLEGHVCDLSSSRPSFSRITPEREVRYSNLVFDGDDVLLLTNDDAENGRIVRGSLAELLSGSGTATFATIVPERPDRVIEEFVIAGDRLITHEQVRATSYLFRRPLAGGDPEPIDLPGPGTIASLASDEPGWPVVLTWSLFVTPPSAFVLDDDATAFRPLAPERLPAGVNLSGISVAQVTYRSKDGTTITMFLAGQHQALDDRNGDTPTILAGYGGFNVSKTSAFNPAAIAWMQQGGLVAVANLRGGGEYGEAWHRAGMLGNKQNVFDDFIAAARWLIEQRYTRPERLAVRGRSNGGLLTGAFLTQAPDLCAAVSCGVPLLDMVRYHRFSIARLWIPEYGSSDDADAFAWIHAYSPYHHVESGRRYPATLFSTADEDARVDPLHARKMTALMQAEAANGHDDDQPILLRVEANAGHGVGKPRHKQIGETLDEGCFIARQFGVDLV